MRFVSILQAYQYWLLSLALHLAAIAGLSFFSSSFWRLGLIQDHKRQQQWQEIYLTSQSLGQTAKGRTTPPNTAQALQQDHLVEPQSTQPQSIPPQPEDSASGLRAPPPSISLHKRLRGGSGATQNPHPIYPHLARKNGWQGTVVLKAKISSLGEVTAVEIVSSSGFAVLDESALASLKQWIFEPTRQAQLASESTLQIPFVFVLKPQTLDQHNDMVLVQ